MEYKARRRHVPAFGEWNYYSSSSSPEDPQPPSYYSGAAAADVGGYSWYAPAEVEARSDAWFRYSPPPRRAPPPKKARRPAATSQKPCCDDEDNGGGVPAMEARAARVSNAAVAARATPGKGARRVVRPVDADLYRVPPAAEVTVSRRPRRVRTVPSTAAAKLRSLSPSG
ncbi:hypothetical protein HU200_058356 [Digitaria exilis]|uniref:Uncharacterized protein n=1 Tax=Digitaria exilis TaxID=1010633 RepID=A0A835ADL5_9POAL|nr:hypothetical protein HU200_058356 [Digitaria exilis]